MTDGLSKAQVKWLTYLIYILLTVLSATVGWQQVTVSALQSEMKIMPDKYVRAERYLTDQNRLEQNLCGISSKLDRLIERYTK